MNPALKAAPAVQPVDLGFFAGVLDYSKLNIIYRTIMKSKMKDKGVPEGDFRNWGESSPGPRGLVRLCWELSVIPNWHRVGLSEQVDMDLGEILFPS